ncbi:MAG: phage holin family protein [Nitrospirae bacterium]|nr:phage holin family protein [Nitrospirota bacterium]
MRGLLIRFTVTGVAVLLASAIIPGIEVESASAGLAAVIVLAMLNALVRPILYLFSLPFIVLTLGVFMVVINALLLLLVAFLVKGFVVTGFWSSVGGAILISLVSGILNLWVSEQWLILIVINRPKRPRVIN